MLKACLAALAFGHSQELVTDDRQMTGLCDIEAFLQLYTVETLSDADDIPQQELPCVSLGLESSGCSYGQSVGSDAFLNVRPTQQTASVFVTVMVEVLVAPATAWYSPSPSPSTLDTTRPPSQQLSIISLSSSHRRDREDCPVLGQTQPSIKKIRR